MLAQDGHSYGGAQVDAVKLEEIEVDKGFDDTILRFRTSQLGQGVKLLDFDSCSQPLSKN